MITVSTRLAGLPMPLLFDLTNPKKEVGRGEEREWTEGDGSGARGEREGNEGRNEGVAGEGLVLATTAFSRRW